MSATGGAQIRRQRGAGNERQNAEFRRSASKHQTPTILTAGVGAGGVVHIQFFAPYPP
jgi:hypothetical protein